MVGHNLAMIGGHWSSASGDTMHLICHVTSQKHAGALIGMSPPYQV